MVLDKSQYSDILLLHFKTERNESIWIGNYFLTDVPEIIHLSCFYKGNK